jgi:hypothetical protein
VDRAGAALTSGPPELLRVATANIRDGLPRREARAALRLVADEDPDLIALQEWSLLRRRLLREVAPGYEWHTPVVGGCPVGVRRDRFEILHRGTRPLSWPGAEALSPRRWSLVPGRVAGVVVCGDLASGRVVAMVSFHLVPGVQRDGDYRRDRRFLVSRHGHESTRLENLIAELTGDGHLVCAAGDTNFHGFLLPGLVSCWSGHEAPGTLGTRLVDTVFWHTAADSVKLVEIPSDHRAVIATVRLG